MTGPGSKTAVVSAAVDAVKDSPGLAAKPHKNGLPEISFSGAAGSISPEDFFEVMRFFEDSPEEATAWLVANCGNPGNFRLQISQWIANGCAHSRHPADVFARVMKTLRLAWGDSPVNRESGTAFAYELAEWDPAAVVALPEDADFFSAEIRVSASLRLAALYGPDAVDWSGLQSLPGNSPNFLAVLQRWPKQVLEKLAENDISNISGIWNAVKSRAASLPYEVLAEFAKLNDIDLTPFSSNPNALQSPDTRKDFFIAVKNADTALGREGMLRLICGIDGLQPGILLDPRLPEGAAQEIYRRVFAGSRDQADRLIRSSELQQSGAQLADVIGECAARCEADSFGAAVEASTNWPAENQEKFWASFASHSELNIDERYARIPSQFLAQCLLAGVIPAAAGMEEWPGEAILHRIPFEDTAPGVLSDLGEAFGAADPETACHWVQEIDDERARAAITSGLVAKWAEEFPDDASEWVDQIPAGPARDAGARALSISAVWDL